MTESKASCGGRENRLVIGQLQNLNRFATISNFQETFFSCAFLSKPVNLFSSSSVIQHCGQNMCKCTKTQKACLGTSCKRALPVWPNVFKKPFLHMCTKSLPAKCLVYMCSKVSGVKPSHIKTVCCWSFRTISCQAKSHKTVFCRSVRLKP